MKKQRRIADEHRKPTLQVAVAAKQLELARGGSEQRALQPEDCNWFPDMDGDGFGDP